MRGALAFLCCLWSQVGLAQGFATHDLTQIAEGARSALGPGASAQAEPQRLILTCTACAGSPSAELQLGRLTDGTEARVRSGKTSLGALEDICRARNPACRLSSLGVGPAIGWISVYALETGGGATAVILRDGDLLTVAVRSASRGTAEDAARHLVTTIASPIVGP